MQGGFLYAGFVSGTTLQAAEKAAFTTDSYQGTTLVVP
jgi:hypothetical protein